MGACLVLVVIFFVVIMGLILIHNIINYVNRPKETEIETNTPEVQYRLPLNIEPIHYNIDLELSLLNQKQNRFYGECFIEIKVLRNTNQIHLHIMNLNIDSAKYYKKNTRDIVNLPKVTPNPLTDIVVYNLHQELKANEFYILHYKFKSVIGEDMRGLYRSKYATSEWFFASQPEPTNARSVVPCFDEPNFKSSFNLSLTYSILFQSQGPTAIYNRKRTEEYSFKVIDSYATTPKMSTYLLNFFISKFSVRKNSQISVAARREYFSQTEYIFDCANQLSTAFHEYFNTSFTGTSQYRINLNAFPHSALSESLILYDKNQSPLNSKQLAANIAAYEVSKLWWGHLVTFEWWSYYWMSVGFATYFQYHVTHLVDSSFDMPGQFEVDVIQTVMNMDATGNTMQLTNENVRTKTDISFMLSSISSNKGAIFIRMTKHILGEEKFRKSLNEYLTTHAYKNTRPLDLFNIWKKYWPAAHHEFSQRYFDSFTTQPGVPLVTFKRTSETTVEVSQKRFLLTDADTADTADSKLIYAIPISLTTSLEEDFQNTQPKFFILETPVTYNIRKNTSWVIGNNQNTGYYRVNYDTATWNRIFEKLNSDSRIDIHESNRAQIVDDVLNLARAGKINYTWALKVLQYLKFEKSYYSWIAALNGFSYLMTRLGNEADIFYPYIRDIINGTFFELGFEEKNGDTALDIYKRAKILDCSCKSGITECKTKAKSYFDQNIKTNSVPVNIRKEVYCEVMRGANESEFNTLYTKYTSETVASEKVLILDSLCCVKDSRLVNRFFEIIISDIEQREDKFNLLFNLCTKNKGNADLVFDLIDQNIERVVNAIGGYSSVAVTVFETAEYFATDAQLQKLKSFLSKHATEFGSSIDILQMAVKRVESNLKWSIKYLGDIKSFMNSYMRDNHA